MSEKYPDDLMRTAKAKVAIDVVFAFRGVAPADTASELRGLIDHIESMLESLPR